MRFLPKSPFFVPVISLFVVIASAYSFYRFQTVGTLSPFSSGFKSGSMYFTGSNRVGMYQSLTIKVMIDTNAQSANAAGFYLKFDPDHLQVNEINTLASFCQYYPEKKFDNRLGIISLACGSPHPGYKGVNELISITFTPVSVGPTTLQMLNSSKLLLSDGKGTNILSNYPAWEVQIVQGI